MSKNISQVAALQLHEALVASQKVVNVEVALDDLENLKKSGYKLCFAKKVGDSFNVVWESYSDYLFTNSFSWTPQYELFGTNTFQSGVEVRATTNIQPCNLGNQCTLNEFGILEAQVSGGPDTSMTMVNEYGSIHPGVNQLSTGIDGRTTMTPIYVAENSIVTGEVVLTPKEEVRVWFQQNIETSTMISDSTSNYIDLNLTQINELSCKYENQKWTLV
ncbi:hypothetical protein [uncultured Kordia sp.]|uniref:hypothetical protein n=1 Tax=uncultured Kordia sp. TaxID=507699 RepID=UPI00261C9714|nr:hypothetical protein [uncultured Kordia sp.]